MFGRIFAQVVGITVEMEFIRYIVVRLRFVLLDSGNVYIS